MTDATPIATPIAAAAAPRFLSAALAGRCANGYERGQGVRVHAVPYSVELERNGYVTERAACGAKPGRRSAGWSPRLALAVTCPACLRKLALPRQ